MWLSKDEQKSNGVPFVLEYQSLLAAQQRAMSLNPTELCGVQSGVLLQFTGQYPRCYDQYKMPCCIEL